MKKISHRFSSGFGDWQVMLPVEFEKENGLSSLLDEALWNGRPWNGDRTIPFILVGDRTWDLSTEEFEELGHEGFEKKYPHGKPLHQPGTNGEEFRDVLRWGAMISIEHQVTENPANGGGGVYRIVSPKIKEVLEQFHLPPHRFYPAEVTHEITGEKKPYYLFHLTRETGGRYENTYWPAMETYITKQGEIINKFDKGSFKDIYDFRQQCTTFKRDHANIKIKGKIDSSTKEGMEARSELRKYDTKHPYFIFTQPYDLIWLGVEMLISNNLKAALDKASPEQEWGFKLDNDHVDVVTGYEPGEELPF